MGSQMKTSTRSISLISAVALAAIVLQSSPAVAGPPSVFLDAEFAKGLCDAWNKSALPAKLGAKSAGGSGWIEEKNKYTGVRNTQEMLLGRRDCKGWKPAQLTIENKDGKAVCTYGGKIVVDLKKAAWAFSPKTVDWYRFATKWSAMDMPGIMTGFRGPIPVARKNLKNFGMFWKLTGKLAKSTSADYSAGCAALKGSHKKKIAKFLKKIK